MLITTASLIEQTHAPPNAYDMLIRIFSAKGFDTRHRKSTKLAISPGVPKAFKPNIRKQFKKSMLFARYST